MIIKSSNYSSNHSINKIIASDSDIDEAIKALWQKWNKYTSENWIVLDVILKHSIKIFE